MDFLVHLVNQISQLSNRAWELRDKRTDGWFLTDSPLTTVWISLVYLFSVKVSGPRFMANREPFELRRVIVAYNVFQICFNSYIFYHICRLSWFNGYSLICQPVDYSDNEDALQIVMIGYCFYISKLIDFFDTVFFMLRKKNNQITFLHLIHHSAMPLSVWICFRFIVGGHCCFIVTFNSLVHVFMYLYYLMSAMGPQFQKYLWWKKYLTVFQMVQFVLVSLHSIQLLFIECDFPTVFSWWSVIQALLFLNLFKNYHSKTYGTNVNLVLNPLNSCSCSNSVPKKLS